MIFNLPQIDTLDSIILMMANTYDISPFEISRYDIAAFANETICSMSPDNISEQMILDSLRRIFLTP